MKKSTSIKNTFFIPGNKTFQTILLIFARIGNISGEINISKKENGLEMNAGKMTLMTFLNQKPYSLAKKHP